MTPAPYRSVGIAILLLSTLVGLLIALYAYFTPLTGVNGTAGALAAIIAALLILLLSGALPRLEPGVGRILGRIVLIILLAGNCFAGLLLHEWGLAAAMVVGFIGLVLDMLGAGRIARTKRHEAI